MTMRGLLAVFWLFSASALAQTQAFTDDLGRVVQVPVHPQRIVSLHDLDITIPLIELGVPPVASHGRTRPDGSHFLRSSAQLTGIDFANNRISSLPNPIAMCPLNSWQKSRPRSASIICSAARRAFTPNWRS